MIVYKFGGEKCVIEVSDDCHGFRHRLRNIESGECTDWAPYTQATVLGDEIGVTPFFVGGADVKIISVSEFLEIIAVGPKKEEAYVGIES